VSCGTCPVGTCQDNGCTSRGQACTPGPNACAAGEACLFDNTSDRYRCEQPFDSRPCRYVIGVNPCRNQSGEEYFVCASAPRNTPDRCIRLCLTSVDCPRGTTCQPYFGRGTISPAEPGYCP
jgi:hypothetical protein